MDGPEMLGWCDAVNKKIKGYIIFRAHVRYTIVI
jgi:hypothetical protein